MNHLRFITLILFLASFVVPASAANYRCITFAYLNRPGYITGLNNAGQAVGTVYDADGNPEQGFLRSVDGSFAVIRFPGAKWTSSTTINNSGKIAGTYADAAGTTHGFTRDAGGNYVSVDPSPGTGTGALTVYGINDNDDLSASRGNQLFVVDAGGSVVNQMVSAAYYPVVGPVNNSREFAFLDSYIFGGGGDRQGDGTIVTSNFPGDNNLLSNITSAPWGLNNLGDTTGFWLPHTAPGGPGYYSFVHTGSSYSGVSCPGFETDGLNNATKAYAINDSGVVAGSIQAGTTALSFIATPTGLAPQLQLSRSSWNFSPHPIGHASGNGKVQIVNSGNAPLHIPNLANAPVSGGNTWDFRVVGTDCPLTIPVGQMCNITFNFMASGPGYRQAALILADDSPDGPHMVYLAGTGLMQSLLFKPNRWVFSAHPVGQTSGAGKFFVTNSSDSIATISDIRLQGANPGDFKITGNTCVAPLAVLATCNVTFAFTPLAKGTRTAWLAIANSVWPFPVEAEVTGEGQ
jgi:hypothetical protein